MSTVLLLALLCVYLEHMLSEELQCSNEELERCQERVIELESLQSSESSESLNNGNNDNISYNDNGRIITCNDVPKSLHLRYKNQCIHECIEPHSCCSGIISCYPYNNCIIKCIGTATCHHIRIDFISGAAQLHCHGFNTCKYIKMNAVQTYLYKNMPINIHDKQQYDPQNDEDFEWFLPHFIFNLDDLDHHVMEFKNINITLNAHYILVQNILTMDIVDKIIKSQKKCIDIKRDNHTEHREFGYLPNYNINGHQVTFLDDCVHGDVYKFIKSVTIGILRWLQIYTMKELKIEDISIQEYISNNWLYDWQSLMILANKLESRVIEYIVYSDGGNLGWHTDESSNFTVVASLNDANSFNGGILKFRMNLKDKEEHQVRLNKYDIIMFPSIADHAVTEIKNGERHILVFEWWNIGRSRKVGRISPENHIKDMKRRRIAKKRIKKKKHWSTLF